MKDIRLTEQESKHHDLELKTLGEILQGINQEDQSVPLAVKECIPQIESLVEAVVERMRLGGRLFYLGAGTSGRLGIVDASECPPTFGVSHDMVIGIIAGGDQAIRKAVEFAEDDRQQGWKDLEAFQISPIDSVIGLSASGTAPYVIGALTQCKDKKILTGCITCNLHSPLAQISDFPVECLVGPEYLTGSTRMKSGTAQKLILNMISTSVMIQLGRVKGNKMVDMQLSNKKLIERGVRMIMELGNVVESIAREELLSTGSVRKALENLQGK